MKDLLLKASSLALLLAACSAKSEQGINDFVVGDFDSGFTEGFDSVYLEHCAVCHGDKMQGSPQGSALVGAALATEDLVDDTERELGLQGFHGTGGTQHTHRHH